jgi:hypothetical protein
MPYGAGSPSLRWPTYAPRGVVAASRVLRTPELEGLTVVTTATADRMLKRYLLSSVATR